MSGQPCIGKDSDTGFTTRDCPATTGAAGLIASARSDAVSGVKSAAGTVGAGVLLDLA